MSAIDFITAKSNVLLTDTAFAKNESALLFHVKHNWWDSGINDSKIICDSVNTNSLFIKNNIIQFYDKKIVLLNKQNEIYGFNKTMESPLNIDYLIVSNNPKLKMENVLKVIHPQKIIFDSSNSVYRINKWKEECAANNQNCYSVAESGALTENL